MGWLPPGIFEEAVGRWPQLAARVGTRDYPTYARVVQGTLIDVAREHTRHPVLVPLDLDELAGLADAAGLDVADWRTRAALAANLAESGRGLSWPPGRNEPCWCGSGRKYKKCCDTVPLDPASTSDTNRRARDGPGLRARHHPGRGAPPDLAADRDHR